MLGVTSSWDASSLCLRERERGGEETKTTRPKWDMHMLNEKRSIQPFSLLELELQSLSPQERLQSM